MVHEGTVHSNLCNDKSAHDQGSHFNAARQEDAQKEKENMTIEVARELLLADVVDVHGDGVVRNAESSDDYT